MNRISFHVNDLLRSRRIEQARMPSMRSVYGADIVGPIEYVAPFSGLEGREMDGLLTILREVRDPRDVNARHNLAVILFIALSASLCGAKNCVEYADFGSSHETCLGAWERL